MDKTISILHKIGALLGFSRAPQSFLSISQPAIAALIAVKSIPNIPKLLWYSSVAFAGYLTIFAVNDLLDKEIDQNSLKYHKSNQQGRGFDIDASFFERHPLATGTLNKFQAILWIAFLFIYTMISSWLINPTIFILFILIFLFEVLYCRLAKITPLKFIFTGSTVALGTLAGWFAFRSDLNLPLLLTMSVWMLAWEAGGRNIPNDFSDIIEDKEIGLKTAPIVYGKKITSYLIVFLLIITFLSGILIGYLADMHWVYFPITIFIGWFTLLLPSFKLINHTKPEIALQLFNKASLYPVIMLLPIIIAILI